MEFPDSSCRISCEVCSGASPERTRCEARAISKPGQVSRLTNVSLVSGFALGMYPYTTACSPPAARIGPAARTPTEKASPQTVAAVRKRCAMAGLTASPRWPTTKVSSSGLTERQKPKPRGHRRNCAACRTRRRCRRTSAPRERSAPPRAGARAPATATRRSELAPDPAAASHCRGTVCTFAADQRQRWLGDWQVLVRVEEGDRRGLCRDSFSVLPLDLQVVAGGCELGWHPDVPDVALKARRPDQVGDPPDALPASQGW